ncbi:MAG TPA: hypothetical protein VGF30_02505, partial [Bacteroidia bacterium]
MAIKRISYLKLVLLISLFGTFSFDLKASHEVGSARLSSPNVLVNGTLSIQDNKFSAIATMPSITTWGFYDKSFTNRLILGIDRNSTTPIPAFVATVTVQVSYASPQALGTGVTTVYKTLSVSYEGVNDHKSTTPHPSVNEDVFSFSNGYNVTTKITGISVSMSGGPAMTIMPENVYLQLETDAERFYTLDQNTSPFGASDVVINYLQASDEFEVSWSGIVGAEQYDLEWLWLDGERNTFWTLNPQIDFRNNSTRIRTSQQSYRISNVFEKGQVFFRIRGVGKSGLTANAFDKDAYTPWSWQDLTTISTGTITSPIQSGTDVLFFVTIDGVTPLGAVIPPLHEFNKNWQYKATYAEEGKKKEIISYFDGSLRSRQSVTKSNSDNNVLVGETYYDYNGRPAVQALPVPLEDAKIKFYQYNVSGHSGFNFDVNTQMPYDKSFFDLDPATNPSTICSVVSSGLDPNYGSSYYYSGNNLNKQFAQGYVPNAENFPISQTEYTNDNTGRISKQGGVGKAHQLGTNHETKYFYGTPEQVELDRLFGSEVGYNKHYKKNMVVDANGQVSLSYIDQVGRTIATALSGQNPQNLQALTDAQGNVLYSPPSASNLLDVDLLNKADTNDYDTDFDNNERIGDELTFTKQILVPTAGIYKFSYDLQGTGYTYNCLPDNACYDCIYNLDINIYDNCMQNPSGFTPISKVLGNIIPPASPEMVPLEVMELNSTCDQTVNFSTSQLNQGGDLEVYLEQGSYTITKTLKINKDAMAFYLGEYLKSDCVKTIEDFKNDLHPDTSGCSLTCDECVAALGSPEAYVAAHGPGSEDDWMREYQICKEPCEYVSLCETEYITMLADVSPGGQYADWEDGNGECDPSLHNLSVLNESNQLPGIKNFSTLSYQAPRWRNPQFRISANNNTNFAPEYRDEYGNPAKILINRLPDAPGAPNVPVYSLPVSGTVTPTPVVNGQTGVGAQFTVRPQDLANVCDFIAKWQNSWAKSLVLYHPEYAYYDWCLKNSYSNLTSPHIVTTGTGNNAITDTIFNSDDYDSLLLSTDDIIGLTNADLAILCNPINVHGGTNYDP